MLEGKMYFINTSKKLLENKAVNQKINQNQECKRKKFSYKIIGMAEKLKHPLESVSFYIS